RPLARAHDGSRAPAQARARRAARSRSGRHVGAREKSEGSAFFRRRNVRSHRALRDDRRLRAAHSAERTPHAPHAEEAEVEEEARASRAVVDTAAALVARAAEDVDVEATEEV